VRKFWLVCLILAPPVLKPLVLKWVCGAKLGRGVRIGWLSAVMGRTVSIGEYSEIRPLTVIICDGDVAIGAYTVVSSLTLAYGCASFSLGDHCYIGPQCLINVDEDVRVGSVSAIGPRSVLFTHGSFLPVTEGYWTKLGGVTIGGHVWLAAGVFVHPGVRIGDEVFVNSRSVIAEDVPGGVVAVGFPAKPVGTMRHLRRHMSPPRVDAVLSQMLQRFGDVVLERKLRICVERDGPDSLRFAYGHRRYLVFCVRSNGADVPFAGKGEEGRLIALVNKPTWKLPEGSQNPLIFDLQTMRTCRSIDTIHTEFWQFMRMYYGLTFEFGQPAELA
jgi:acetyltransferase-like isoleucine patch superfamily enzyme